MRRNPPPPGPDQPLASRIAGAPVPVPEALRIAVGIARGIEHAHANGVAHRDLTPENVLLRGDGRVTVLGLVTAEVSSRPGIERGPRRYAAPEQRRGAPADERADVFAIGVILYRMLAGELPFPDERAVASGFAPVLHVPDAPGLGEAVARMLDGDPVQRPRDAGEVVALLAPFLEAQELTPSTGSPRPRRRRRRLRLWAVALFVSGAAAASIVAWGVQRAGLGRDPQAPRVSSEPSIAVLPFVDASPGKDHEYLADGLADEILNALASVEGLRVPSRTSCFYFKGRNASLGEIGKELQVAVVLEGSVRVVGKHVRVTTQLVNVADGRHLWGQTYDRELTDLFAVEGDIARAVVDALRVKLLGGPEARHRGERQR